MALVKGKEYTINGNAGFVYKFSTVIFGGRFQHWFFHVGGYLNQSLRDEELSKFITA